MVNFNGTIATSPNDFSFTNRAFLYGDAVFETLKIVDSKILFFEDHYFRLMASMRILRMEIPQYFTLEFIEEQLLATAKKNNIEYSARARLTVFRNDGGLYLPKDNSVSFIIKVTPLENKSYVYNNQPYEVDLYKDFYIQKHLLSTLKTTNRIINVTGSIFAQENDLNNCLLLNNEKNIVEALNGNIFMLANNTLITPHKTDGCINGILRKQLIDLCKKEQINVLEQAISPFDLQKADEQ
jgi:branched-chain amino acid aminotransferase